MSFGLAARGRGRERGVMTIWAYRQSGKGLRGSLCMRRFYRGVCIGEPVHLCIGESLHTSIRARERVNARVCICICTCA